MMVRFICLILLSGAALAGADRLVEVKRQPKDKEWKPLPTRLLADLGDLGPSPRPATDAWGGRADQQEQATGFFHLARLAGRHTWIDPDGHPFLSVGVCGVGRLRTDGAQQALAARFGNEAGWAQATHQLLRDAGFNTLACWSEAKAFASLAPPLAYTTQFNVVVTFAKKYGLTFQAVGHAGFKDDLLPVFHADWPAFCDDYLAAQVAGVKDDPRLLGHFSDNELPFKAKALDLHLAQPDGSPGRLAAERWAQDRRLDTARIADADRQAFLAFYAEAYFRPIAAALRKHDPRHLYLGSRFHGGDARQEALFRAAGRHVDAISFNWYGQWTPDLAIPALWVAWSGKPYLVTEWYAKAMDAGLANTTGAGWTVKTQADRAAFYHTFTLGLLADPACIGWHWFKYQDNDPTDPHAEPSNIDANKGLVGNRYAPWAELLQAAAALNRELYRLRDRLCPPT